MAQENNASQQLYDLLVTRDFDPKSLNAMGKPTVNPGEADLFSFNFKNLKSNCHCSNHIQKIHYTQKFTTPKI